VVSEFTLSLPKGTKTGIQNAKNEHPDRTFHMMDAGFPMFSYRDCKG
jgi:hypothetical protein